MNSVFIILFNIATQIRWLLETTILAITNKDYLNQIYYTGFYNQIPYSRAIAGIAESQLIIYSCSFLEEYEKELIPSKHVKYSNKIIEFKKITKPAITRIKKWKGLKEVRNNIIAHNLRIKGSSIFETKKIIKYNIPSTDEEFVLLADLIFLIAENIAPIFPEIVLNTDFDIKLNQYVTYHSDKIECFEEFQKIKEEINKIKKYT